MMANMDRQEPSRANAAVCDLCFTTVTDYITNPCAHVFCWDCILKFRNESNSSRGSCPTCFFNKNPETSVQHRMKDTRVYQESRNSSTFYTHAFQANRSQPLQLVSTTSTGQLMLVESTVQRCFLECEDHPVYVISVVGERRAGKSFLMNYLMRALRSLERTNKANLGGDNEVLNGFPWGPGADKATKGIWIWGKPFLLENNGNKVAVFLLDSEGTDNTTQYEPASIKLRVLNMMISSHLVYNVKTEVKQTDIDYVEIYCDPNENDPYHPFFGLQHFDVLVRDWSDTEEDFGDEAAKLYIKRQIQDLGKRHVRSILNLVEKNIVRCFLMPYPGDITAEDEDARLRDMDEDFQNCLRRFLMCVVERTQKCESAMTCKKMAEKLKVCVEYVQNQRYFSTSYELCNQLKSTIERKTEREMERINTEFETFLNNQTQWRLPSQMSDVVSKKVSEVIAEFCEHCMLIRGEHHTDLVGMLLDQLKEKSNTFCDTHRKNLKYNGLKTAVHIGLMAAASTATPFLLPAAAPAAAAGGWFASIGGWFSAAPAAATTASSEIFGMAAAGVSMLQAGAGFLLRRPW